jgi:hypothetical protein
LADALRDAAALGDDRAARHDLDAHEAGWRAHSRIMAAGRHEKAPRPAWTEAPSPPLKADVLTGEAIR